MAAPPPAPSERPRSLHSPSRLFTPKNSVADVRATQADVLQFPVAKPGKRCQGLLAGATGIQGSDPAIDPATEARHKKRESSSGRRHARREALSVGEHRHGSQSFKKVRMSAFATLLQASTNQDF
jgi:hypothetical protein